MKNRRSAGKANEAILFEEMERRLLLSAQLDTGFGNAGLIQWNQGTGTTAAAIAIQSDGDLIVAGSNTWRFTSSGLDTTFGNSGTAATSAAIVAPTANAVAVQADNKIVIAGFATVNSASQATLVRYTADGQVDSSFGTNGQAILSVGLASQANAVAILSDGSILIGGWIQDVNHNGGVPSILLAKYTSSGQLDTTFGVNGVMEMLLGGVQNSINSLTVLSNGKIIAGGTYVSQTTVGGKIVSSGDFLVARFTAAGSLDMAFGQGGYMTADFSGGDDGCSSVAVTSSGDIVAVGYATVGGVRQLAVARFTSAGAVATTFGTSGKATFGLGGTSSRATSVIIQSDGQIVVTGDMVDAATGVRHLGLVRLSDTGVLDSSIGSVESFAGSGGAAAIYGGRLILAGQQNGGEVAEYNLGWPDIIVQSAGATLSSGQTVTFNPVLLNDSPTSMTFTISNGGDTALRISSISSLTHFTVSSPTKTTLNQGETATFTVTPLTTATGSFSETLTIATNDPHTPAYTLTVASTVKVNTPPTVTVTDQTVSQSVGTLTVPVTVSDVDGDTVTLVSASVVNPNAAAYQLKTQLNLTTYDASSYNCYKKNEQWFKDGSGNWYYILPTGQLYSYPGNVLEGTLDTKFYTTPSSLISLTSGGGSLPTATVDNVAKTVTVTAPSTYTGAVQVQVTASDGHATTTETFNFTVTPVVWPVSGGTTTVSHDQTSTIALPAVDGSGNAITYTSATVAAGDAVAAAARTSLNLVSYDAASYNCYKKGEQWFKDASGAWYYILPNGQIYNYPGNVLKATVDPKYNTNPASLLTVSAAGPATVALNGSNLQITPGAGYLGTVNVTVTMTEGAASNTQTIPITVTNTAPALTVTDQTMSQRDGSLTAPVTVSDADGDTVILTTLVLAGDSAAYQLKTQLNLVSYDAASYNCYKKNEQWFKDGSGNWYYILPTGALYSYSGGVSTLKGTISTSYWSNPQSLIALTSGGAGGSVPTVTVDNVAKTLTLNSPSTFSGTVQVQVTASDGLASTVKTFNLVVTPVVWPVSGGTTTVSHDQTSTIALPAVDGSGNAITYTGATVAAGDAVAAAARTSLNLVSYDAASYNCYKKGEQWFKDASGAWYYILPTGQIYSYPGNVLSAAVDPKYNTNPASLLTVSATGPATVALNGSNLQITPGAGYLGTVNVTVTMTDGAASNTQTIPISVVNNPPAVSVSDQTMAHTDAPLVIQLPTTDADGDKVTYTVSAGGSDLAAYQLKTQLNLVSYDPSSYNCYKKNEQWFKDASGAWYYILPTGQIYNYPGNQLKGTVDVKFYNDPNSLISLTSGGGTVTAGVDNTTGKLTITPTGALGATTVSLTATDALGASTSVTFKVTTT